MPFLLGRAEMVHCFRGIGEHPHANPSWNGRHAFLTATHQRGIDEEIESNVRFVALPVAAAHMKKALVVFLRILREQPCVGVEEIL
jgi:hypothetical protein